ncbi:MAG: Hpt domain-containing protein, partial [Roseburia sp.]
FVDEDDAKNESVEHKGQQNGEEVCAAAETASENTSGEEDRFSRLESAGIHTKSGLQYCQGDAEFYMELLTKFAQDASHKENEIQKFFVQEDLGNYRILVHALKSTAKMVGAESLSEMARCAEEAAKNDDMSYIRAHQEELLEAYRELVQQIKDILNTGEPVPVSDVQETGTEVSTEELLENLEELSASLGTYEADKAEELISRMRGFLYQGNSVAELLHEVRQDVEDFELAAAQEKVEAIINGRKGGEA